MCFIWLLFLRLRRGAESEADMWSSKEIRIWIILQTLLRVSDFQNTGSFLKYLFSYQMGMVLLNMEGSIKPGKSIINWLSSEWKKSRCSQRNNSVMGLWSWLMVNWCFNTGKQMNIWRTPGCELQLKQCSCWLSACAQFTLSKAHPAF